MLAAIADRIRSESYELPLSRDNVRHWGLKEAVRELIQNALDSESPFEYAFAQGQLFITSRFARLEARTLVLGSTSKSDRDDAIGSFGEGYKTLSRRCRSARRGSQNAIIGELYETIHWPSAIYAAFFEFAFFTGMRPQEIIALRWNEVDKEIAALGSAGRLRRG